MLQNERSHHSEKPVHRNEDPGQPWINKVNMFKKNVLKKTLKQTVHHTFLCTCPFRVSTNSYSHQLILCKSVCFFSISQFSSFQFSCSVVSDSLRCHGLQHTRFSEKGPSFSVSFSLPASINSQSHSCPSHRWCHPTFSSSVFPFSSSPQSFPASGSFPMSQLFESGGQSIGVSTSASVLPMNIQDWFPLGLTDWVSLQFKRLSRVFSNTAVQKHQFFSAQLSF